MKNDLYDPFDPANLAIKDMPAIPIGVPRKIQKRQQQYAPVPMWWYGKLFGCQSGAAILLAVYLAYLDWKNKGKPVKLPNGMLVYDGSSRQTKWRVLRMLERRGIIRIDCRNKKSPIIHVHREAP